LVEEHAYHGIVGVGTASPRSSRCRFWRRCISELVYTGVEEMTSGAMHTSVPTCSNNEKCYLISELVYTGVEEMTSGAMHSTVRLS
jgi:hypothetical protein